MKKKANFFALLEIEISISVLRNIASIPIIPFSFSPFRLFHIAGFKCVAFYTEDNGMAQQ